MKTLTLTTAVAALLAAAPASADETRIRMRDGPELMTLVANCSGCHSLDYIQMNSRWVKRAGWEAEVKKMVTVMGAPVSPEDQAKLVDYLTREYGVAD
jgi:mono/diheme cytochrome c family protein